MTVRHQQPGIPWRLILGGWVLVIAVFGIGGTWAAIAPLARGILVPGTINPEGSRRIIQHLDGGIIAALPVDEGDAVRRGDILMRLRTDDLAADLTALLGQFHALRAERDRLDAVRRGVATVRFTRMPDRQADQTLARAARQSQAALFASREAAIKAQRDILRADIRQLQAQIRGLEQQIDSLTTQEDLIAQEWQTVEQLLARGHARKPRLLALQRSAAQLAGERGARLADIAHAKQAIGAAEIEIIRLRTDRIDAANTRLAEIQAQLPQVEQAVRKTRLALERQVVRAPIDGRVIDLRFRTLNGVVAPGDRLMDIVPVDEDLVIEAQVRTLDIDTLRPGMSADIVLTAYPRRTTPRLTGRVTRISADIKAGPDDQTPHYAARIVVDAGALARLPRGVTLYPGMPAEVMIRADDRTVLHYLIEPVLASFQRSLMEP